MLTAAVLAWLWAQAEAAPPEPPLPPPSAAPAPAVPPVIFPAAAPGDPTLPTLPTSPASPMSPATALPAAPGTAAPSALATVPLPPAAFDNALGIYGCFAYRLGNEGQSVGPAIGFSLGGEYERRYFATPPGLELGAGLDFFYDRFASDVTGSAMVAPGQEQAYAAQRLLSQTSFALIQTAAWRIGRVRPFVKLGFGATIAYFSSPELQFRPGSFDAVQPLGRAATGLSVVVYRNIALSLRIAYSHLFTRPVYRANDAATYSFLGDLFDLGLGVVMPF
jgi:hypothetical protein